MAFTGGEDCDLEANCDSCVATTLGEVGWQMVTTALATGDCILPNGEGCATPADSRRRRTTTAPRRRRTNTTEGNTTEGNTTEGWEAPIIDIDIDLDVEDGVQHTASLPLAVMVLVIASINWQ